MATAAATVTTITGRPAITTPGNLDGRPGQAAVQALANNVRERIEKIEGPVNQLLRSAGADSTAKTVEALQKQFAQIQVQIKALSDQVAALKAALTSTGAIAQFTMIEIEGEPGEDGLTIPGAQGPQGEPGAIIMIEGDADDPDFYPPPP